MLGNKANLALTTITSIYYKLTALWHLLYTIDSQATEYWLLLYLYYFFTLLRLYTLPNWCTIFNLWHPGALASALRTERQSARMSKIKNGGLYPYGGRPFKPQQFGTAGVKGVN